MIRQHFPSLFEILVVTRKKKSYFTSIKVREHSRQKEKGVACGWKWSERGGKPQPDWRPSLPRKQLMHNPRNRMATLTTGMFHTQFQLDCISAPGALLLPSLLQQTTSSTKYCLDVLGESKRKEVVFYMWVSTGLREQPQEASSGGKELQPKVSI